MGVHCRYIHYQIYVQDIARTNKVDEKRCQCITKTETKGKRSNKGKKKEVGRKSLKTGEDNC